MYSKRSASSFSTIFFSSSELPIWNFNFDTINFGFFMVSCSLKLFFFSFSKSFKSIIKYDYASARRFIDSIEAEN